MKYTKLTKADNFHFLSILRIILSVYLLELGSSKTDDFLIYTSNNYSPNFVGTRNKFIPLLRQHIACEVEEKLRVENYIILC